MQHVDAESEGEREQEFPVLETQDRDIGRPRGRGPVQRQRELVRCEPLGEQAAEDRSQPGRERTGEASYNFV